MIEKNIKNIRMVKFPFSGLEVIAIPETLCARLVLIRRGYTRDSLCALYGTVAYRKIMRIRP